MIGSLPTSVMMKGEEMASKKDKNGRVLQKGEAYRKDGRYQYRYTNVAGRRCYIYADTLPELRKKECDLQIAAWQGVTQYNSSATLNFMFDRAIAQKIGIKETTLSRYLQSYNNHVRDEFGNQLVKNISHSDVMAFYSDLLRKRKLCIKTIQHIHTQVYSAFKLAVQDGIIFRNPAEEAFEKLSRAAGAQERKMRALTLEEQKAFLSYIEGHPTWNRYHSIFTVMLGTGLRVGELCGLRWQDIDIERRILDVNHNLVRVKAIKTGPQIIKEHLAITLPKSKAGIRQVPMMFPVIEAFMDEYEWAKLKGFKSETIDGYTDFIFTKRNGNVYTAERLDLALREIVRDYNKQEEAVAKVEDREPEYLPHISNHVLRHTFCTRLCERDVNPKVIQTIMGHASIRITMDIYAEVSQAKQFHEIDKLADELDVF